MKIRFFGGDSCPICDIVLLKLESEKEYISYEYIDALADETQDLCDENKVGELPHVQVFDDYDGKIVAEFTGMDVLSMLRDICD